MEVRAINEDSESAQYHIRPEDIDVSRHFYSAFGKAQVESAAQYVVRFCQQLGGWKSFRKEDLEKFYSENGGRKERLSTDNKFPFFWLNEKLLVQRPDGKCCVTDLFIDRCFKSSPNRKI
ncbi:MAG: hypothetical protein Q7S81_01790 [bacterium]|jgi:hypothetical protein|nr:hypothetical protein [bacterium]